MTLRFRAYVDGYNLYHAIRRFRVDHLKWLDLWRISETFVPSRSGRLVGVHYFSAFAYWLPAQMARHRTYVAALEATGVTPHLSQFKEKHRRCPRCGHVHTGHEEKETDVHIALSLLDHAQRDLYDVALLISRDSDLAPAVRVTKQAFPEKKIYAVAPPHLGHSNEILAAADGKHRIQKRHLEQALLPAVVRTADGRSVVRPPISDPPALGRSPRAGEDGG